MRFSMSILAIAAAAAFGISGVALAPAAIAQDVKSADVIVKGLASVKTRGFDPQAPEREAKQQELNAKLTRVEDTADHGRGAHRRGEAHR